MGRACFNLPRFDQRNSLGGLPYVGTALATVYYSHQAAKALEGRFSSPSVDLFNHLVPTGVAPGVDVESTLQLLNQIRHVQVTYGAVLLGFLGAIHWGLEFSNYGGEHGTYYVDMGQRHLTTALVGYRRLALGVAPALYAWPTLGFSPEVALATQWAGFTAFVSCLQ